MLQKWFQQVQHASELTENDGLILAFGSLFNVRKEVQDFTRLRRSGRKIGSGIGKRFTSSLLHDHVTVGAVFTLSLIATLEPMKSNELT